MARHSKHERERRSAETERVKQIEAAWLGSLPAATAKAFAESVAAARARGPQEKRPDMAPGTRAASAAARVASRSRPRTSDRAGPRTATDGRRRGPHVAANDYHFVTTWRIAATPDEIAEILGDAVALGRWWPSVYLRVRVLDDGDARGVGRVVDLWTKGFLPYTLRWRFTVTESDPPHGFRLEASGDFVGRGIWTLQPEVGRRCSGWPADPGDLRLAGPGREGRPQDPVADHEARSSGPITAGRWPRASRASGSSWRDVTLPATPPSWPRSRPRPGRPSRTTSGRAWGRPAVVTARIGFARPIQRVKASG